MAPNTVAANPYIGTRSFRRGETLYGRRRDTRDLQNLLIAERIVLLHSPSGAGKTSLLQSALIPALLAEGFRVLPIVRISQALPPNVALPAGVNRYVLSVLLSLEDKIAEENQLTLSELAGLSLPDYLAQRSALVWESLREHEQLPPEAAQSNLYGTGPFLLVFDQFEEILTVDPTDQQLKVEFFTQLGTVLQRLRDPHGPPGAGEQMDRWALFAMREDYIAGIEPYVRPVPTRLQTTFRLERLDVRSSLEAICLPARDAGVEFSDAAARRLVDDLRKVKLLQADGTTSEKPGPFVEPVQLQVVCKRLWDNLPPDTRRIELEQVAAVGDVSHALAYYYADTVRQVAADRHVSERLIRDWIEEHLISPAGIRTQVLQGPKQSAELSNDAIAELVDAHLLRGEYRHGVYWFELAHDRLIEPIRENNGEWREARLSVLQRSASLWINAGRPDALLLRDDALRDAVTWANAHEDELGEQDRALLAASRRAQAGAERDRRLRRSLYVAAIVALAFGIAAIFGFFQASAFANLANANAAAAEQNATQAKQNALNESLARQTAVANENTARANEQRARSAEAAATEQRQLAERQKAATEVELIKRLAIEAQRDRKTELDKSLLLSLAIDSIFSRTVEADGSLLNGLADDPLVVAYLRGQDELVEALAFSRSGLLAAAGRRDGSIVVWDSATPLSQPVTLTISPDPINVSAIAWAHGQDVLGFGDGNGRVGVWRLKPAPSFAMLGRHSDFVAAAAVSPDDSLLATGSCAEYTTIDTIPVCTSGEIRLWPLGAAAQVSPGPLIGHNGTIEDLAFHPTRPILASAGCQLLDEHGQCLQGQVLFWDPQRGQQIPGGPIGIRGDQIRTLAFSPDGKTLAAGSAAGRVVLWPLDEISGTVPTGAIELPKTHSGAVNDLAYSEDGSRLVTSSCAAVEGRRCTGGQIYIWDAANGEWLGEIDAHAGEVTRVALHGRLLASGGLDGSVILWDLAMRDTFVRRVASLPDPINMLAFAPDRPLLAVAARGAIQLLDSVDRQDPISQTLILTDAVEFTSLAFSPDGGTLAAGDGVGNLWRWNTATWQMQEVLPSGLSGAVVALAYQPHGHALALAGLDTSFNPAIAFWDTTGGAYAVSATIAAHTGYIGGLAFSPDGALMLSGGGDATVGFWNTRTFTVPELLTTSEPVGDVAASAYDSRVLASALLRGAPLLWDRVTRSQESLPYPEGKILPTAQIAFDPVAPLLAGGTTDGHLLFWDTEQKRPIGAPVQSYGSHAVTDVAISADGRWLASGDEEGAVLVWLLDMAAWRRQACQIANRDLAAKEWALYFPDRPQVALCPTPP